MNKGDGSAMESNARELDLAMLALHNSLIPDAIKDYAKSYSRGNTNACPTTAEMVARHLVDNYGNIAVAATFLLRNNRSVPHF